MRLLEKLVGETPLSALQRLRREENIPESVRLSYAGRLDPMASGTLLVLEGEECKDQKRFQGLNKSYRVEVLVGAASDTGDILGIVEPHPGLVEIAKENLEIAAQKLIGPYNAPYPLYSSRTVQGKTLFQWTLEGRAHEIAIPLQHGTIFRLHIDAVRTIAAEQLEQAITKKLTLVPVTTDPRKALGKNFRIDAVRASWKKFFSENTAPQFQIITIEVDTSAGVYMRTLANDLAQLVDTRGLAFSIHRTHIDLPD